jgi:hypothetical protein
MIKSVGIDLGGIGEHTVRCLDEKAQMCDGFGFETSRAGLSKLEERIFSNGSNPSILVAGTFCNPISRAAWEAMTVCPSSISPTELPRKRAWISPGLSFELLMASMAASPNSSS